MQIFPPLIYRLFIINIKVSKIVKEFQLLLVAKFKQKKNLIFLKKKLKKIKIHKSLLKIN
jgi:hypothetical protein